ncbi:hypothetical protein IWZ03DRAFT_377592 [Phyllosticta citriasiana]|uniref:Uncharacterized protein n=2 Tax=Phyllosticta citriasiana TaxID=595635 RepID=A0ABR1KT28_9PEZI
MAPIVVFGSHRSSHLASLACLARQIVMLSASIHPSTNDLGTRIASHRTRPRTQRTQHPPTPSDQFSPLLLHEKRLDQTSRPVHQQVHHHRLKDRPNLFASLCIGAALAPMHVQSAYARTRQTEHTSTTASRVDSMGGPCRRHAIRKKIRLMNGKTRIYGGDYCLIIDFSALTNTHLYVPSVLLSRSSR